MTRLAAAALAALALAASGVAASPLPEPQIHFAGTIEALDAPDLLAGTGIEVGTPFSGFYAVDLANYFRLDDYVIPPTTFSSVFLTSGLVHLEIASFVVDVPITAIFYGYASTGLPNQLVWETLGLSPGLVPLSPLIVFADDDSVRPDPDTLDVVSSNAGWDQSLLYLAPGATFPNPVDSPAPFLAHATLHIVPEPGPLALCLLGLSLLRRNTGFAG